MASELHKYRSFGAISFKRNLHYDVLYIAMEHQVCELQPCYFATEYDLPKTIIFLFHSYLSFSFWIFVVYLAVGHNGESGLVSHTICN